MNIQAAIEILDQLAPPFYQETYDNSGLLVGDTSASLTGILVTLDCTEEVVDEAVRHGCNLIVAHHPILFKPIKKLTGGTYVERVMLKAIKSNISLFAIHTNLDNVMHGVNFKIASMLGLLNLKVLVPKEKTLKKLSTFVPKKAAQAVLHALHQAGAGKIGHYRECSFSSTGTGTFRPTEGTNPYLGQKFELSKVEEEKVEVVFPAYSEAAIIKTLIEAHPYELPAFDIISLDNANPDVGSGLQGELQAPMSEQHFLSHVKNCLNLTLIRHSPFTTNSIIKVALCGGSGSFLLQAAKSAKAQVFLSSDFKYHEFFEADGQILIADINHYEGEVCTKQLLYEHLSKNLPNIATVLSSIKTNPISYF